VLKLREIKKSLEKVVKAENFLRKKRVFLKRISDLIISP
jgi:hypothetical protein